MSRPRPFAVAFPGQAEVDPRALAPLLDDPLLQLAATLTGLDLARTARRGGPALSRTEVLQPLVTALGLAHWRRLPRAPAVVIGHSLGQVAAWAAAGGITAEDAVRLAHARGLAMAEAAARSPGGMVATRSATPPPGTVLAAHNSPDEWVFAGPHAALGAGSRVAAAGPWHHPDMAAAGPGLAAAIAATPQHPLQTAWLDDAGAPVERDPATLDPATLDPAALMLAQLARPVRWPAVVAAVEARGVQCVMVLPPSRVLATHTRRCAPALPVLRADPPAAWRKSLLEL